jgi:hypothetical protein
MHAGSDHKAVMATNFVDPPHRNLASPESVISSDL